MTRVLLVDDHAVVRAGLRAILESSGKPITIHEAGTSGEALAKLQQPGWDAVILDVSLPDRSGLETLKCIKREYSHLPVLMLSVHSEREFGLRALKAGAAGYLEKSAAAEQLLDAIERVLSGRHYVSPDLGERLVVEMAGEKPGASYADLTNREFEIFRLLAAGKRTRAIAEKLHLSPKTVHTHRHSIFKKLGINSDTELVRYALQNEICD